MYLDDHEQTPFSGDRDARIANVEIARPMSNGSESVRAGETSVRSIQLAAQRICDEFSDITLRDAEADMLKRVGTGTSVAEAESEVREILLKTEDFAEGSVEDPSPIPIPELPSVPKLDLGIFPEALREYVADCAARRSSPVEYVAVSTLVALGSAIGTKVGIQPKAHDSDFFLFPNLYALIIGPSGVKKTPSIEDGLRFILSLEEDARKRFNAREAEIDASATCRKLQIEAVERQIKGSYGVGRSKKGTDSIVDREVLKQTLAELKSIKPETAERLIIQDSTIEKIGILLNQNPNGLLAVHDEISPLLDEFGHKEKQRDRGFYLRAANGTGTEIIDRVGREDLYVTNLCLSVIGGIQPARIASLAAATVKKGGDDGLLPRFGITVWPDPPEYNYVDTPPRGVESAKSVFRRLYEMKPEVYRIRRLKDEDGGTFFLTFGEQAQMFYKDWLIRHQQKTRRSFGTNGTDIPAAHYSKYSGLMPKLAFIFQMVDLVSGLDTKTEVSLKNVQRAASWIEFVAAHAIRLYAGTEKPEFGRARTILGHLKSGKLSPIFTARDVHRKHWRDLADAKDVMSALEILVEYQWIRAIRAIRTDTGGRPAAKYVLNDTS